MDLTAIYCPECGAEAEDTAPENYIVAGNGGEYRRADDKTALCAVMTNGCYRPAWPVEHQLSA